MRKTFPEKEDLGTSKIYVEPENMFEGIEKVYPGLEIGLQDYKFPGDNAMLEDAGILECTDCGNTGMFRFEHGSGRHIVTLDETGKLHIAMEAARFPIGSVEIYDDKNEKDGFLNILEDYMQHYHFNCGRCGGMMGWSMWNGENHHDCPGCFLCMRGTPIEAVDFCTEENQQDPVQLKSVSAKN